jgi:hypothetical protein
MKIFCPLTSTLPIHIEHSADSTAITMVFETAEALRQALNAADTAIRQAVQKGNLVEVVRGLTAEVVSHSSHTFCCTCSLTKKCKTKIYKTDAAGHFKAEFHVPRFMHSCCSAFALAARDKALNQAFLDRQVQALADFDRKNNVAPNTLAVPSGLKVGTSENDAPRKMPATYKAGPVPKPVAPITGLPAVPTAAPMAASPAASMAASPAAPIMRITPAPVASGSKSTAKGMPMVTVSKPDQVGSDVRTPTSGGHWQRRRASKAPMADRPTARQSGATRPGQHGPPTEQMAQLGINAGVDAHGEPSVPRFGSLEMDVDEDERQKRSDKRKRDEERSDEEYPGKENNDDDEDDDDEVKEIKPPIKAGAGKATTKKRRGPRAPLKPRDEYHNPPCIRCRKSDRNCQVQGTNGVCYMCARHKVKCEGAGPAGDDVPTSSKKRKIVDDRTSDIEEIPPPPKKTTSAPKKSAPAQHSRKGKGKG